MPNNKLCQGKRQILATAFHQEKDTLRIADRFFRRNTIKAIEGGAETIHG